MRPNLAFDRTCGHATSCLRAPVAVGRSTYTIGHSPTACRAIPSKGNAMNLNTARVFVRDIVEAERFYGTKLGLAIKAGNKERGYCVFSAGSTELVVEVVDSDAPQEDQALVGRFTGLSFTVPDVHAKHSELTAAGVEFTGKPERQFWGGTLATLRDPAGNELQIVQQPVGPAA